MTRCDTCGNDYDGGFSLSLVGGETYHFDSFECAAEKAAPRCNHCGCRILGHGVQAADAIYCCAHCARMSGESNANDNVTSDQSS